MSIPPLTGGHLPLGRWSTTVDEVHDAFVDGRSQRRQDLWGDWLELTEALREILVSVPAAWLGGSFLTDDAQPGDIDSVYVVEWPLLRTARMDDRQARFLEAVGASKVKDVLGLTVDSFILEWWPTSGPTREARAAEYLGSRGYWDDLWSRSRSTDAREDAIPRRGYLEVILDGYS